MEYKKSYSIKWIIGILIFIAICLFLLGISIMLETSGSDKKITGKSINDEYKNDYSTLKVENSALDLMEIAFVGDYSKEEIKTLIDKVMRLYDLPITEENYEKFGSVLVSLRKETGTSEMDILKCMKTMDYKNTLGDNVTPVRAIIDSSAICATMLNKL